MWRRRRPSSRSARSTCPCCSSTSPATRASAERLDGRRLNELVERYFGAFLDEILRNGGDVNETAGDGLMVIFRDPDPRRHACDAMLTAVGIVARGLARSCREPDHAGAPIELHVGVNSGVAAVGATKIEGMAGAALDLHGLRPRDESGRAPRRARRGRGRPDRARDTRAHPCGALGGASGRPGGASDRGSRRAPPPQCGRSLCTCTA